MPQSSLLSWLNTPRTVSASPEYMGGNASPTYTKQIPARLQSNNEEPATAEIAPPAGSQKPGLAVRNRDRSLDNLLPCNVHLRPCHTDDIPHLKRLTSLLLPIPYPEKFYKDITEDSLTNDITLVAAWHDDPDTKGKERGRLVGAIRCRLLARPPTSPPNTNDRPMLYLSTLVLLSPYRHHGIAAQMLQVLTKRAIENYGISSVGAHVWEANSEGLEWYRKRGFREIGREQGYYRRLDPQGAVVMQRDVSVLDLVGD